MIREEEERDLDLDWFAIDSRGAVGHFTTGGCGFLPRGAAVSRADLETVLRFVESLPETGASILHPDRVKVMTLSPAAKRVEPRALYRCWLDSAARGLYAFDYVEDQRRPGRPYWIIARPEVPLHADELPPAIREIIGRATLRDVDFARDDVIGLASLR